MKWPDSSTAPFAALFTAKVDDITKLDRSSFIYTAQFCEENIWCLCRDLVKQGVPISRLHTLFLSSRSRQTPILQQRSSPSPDQPVWWDYHVVLLVTADSGSLVLDFDTCLEFPVSGKTYFQKSFYPQKALQRRHQVYLRKIKGEEFLKRFTSDRSHMIDDHGQPLAPFPDYPPINRHQNGTTGLRDYLNLSGMELLTETTMNG